MLLTKERPLHYLANNPVNATDPTGLKVFIKDKELKKNEAEKLPFKSPSKEKLEAIGNKTTNFLLFAQFIAKQLIDDRGDYNYASDRQFMAHVEYRTWVYVLTTLAYGDPKWTGEDVVKFEGTKENPPECWRPGQVLYRDSVGALNFAEGLKVKKGKTPSEAIKELYARRKEVVMDCATFQSVISRRALLEVLGPALYDKYYKDVGVLGLQVEDDPFKFEEIGNVTAKTGRQLTTGCGLRFQFTPEIAGAFNTENTFFLYENRIVGHPLGAGKPEEIIKQLESQADKAKVRGDAKTRPDIISDIPYRKLPQ